MRGVGEGRGRQARPLVEAVESGQAEEHVAVGGGIDGHRAQGKCLILQQAQIRRSGQI